MFEQVEVWTLFSKDSEPEVYRKVHDTHVVGHNLILSFADGCQVGIPMANVRRWKATKVVV